MPCRYQSFPFEGDHPPEVQETPLCISTRQHGNGKKDIGVVQLLERRRKGIEPVEPKTSIKMLISN